MKMKNVLKLSLLLLVAAQLWGCLVAYEAAVLGNLAANAIGRMENAKIDAAVSPGVTKEQLNQINKVAFLFENMSPGDVFGSGGLTDIMSDNLTLEMMKLGYECIEKQKIKSSLEVNGNQITEPIDLQKALEAGKIIGIHAIITGNIKTSISASSGLLSTNYTQNTLIQNATMKIIGVEKGDVLMVIAINYKRGKKPDEAARSMAKILKTKLENPFGENKK